MKREREGDRFGQRLAHTALKHVAPEHLHPTLNHWAASAEKRLAEGKITGEQLDALTDEQHEASIKALVAENPHIAAAKPKTFAPGKANSMSDHEARAARRAKGITY